MAKDFSAFMPSNPVLDIINKAGKEAETPAEKIKNADVPKPKEQKKNPLQSKLEGKKPIKDKRINLVLTEKQYNELVERAEAQGLSYSAYIRQLIAKDISEVSK